jgi:hypothetical protein
MRTWKATRAPIDGLVLGDCVGLWRLAGMLQADDDDGSRRPIDDHGECRRRDEDVVTMCRGYEG